MRLPLLALLSLLVACRNGGKGDDDGLGTDTGLVDETDADGDGFPASEDCDDDDASVNSGTTEVCDGIDDLVYSAECP